MLRARRAAGPLIGVALGGKAGTAGGSGFADAAGSSWPAPARAWRSGGAAACRSIFRGRSGRRGRTGRRHDRATLEHPRATRRRPRQILAELLVQLGHVARVDGVDGVERLLDRGWLRGSLGAWVAAKDRLPGPPDTGPGGRLAAFCRDRYARDFMRLPQMAMVHHVPERLWSTAVASAAGVATARLDARPAAIGHGARQGAKDAAQEAVDPGLGFDAGANRSHRRPPAPARGGGAVQGGQPCGVQGLAVVDLAQGTQAFADVDRAPPGPARARRRIDPAGCARPASRAAAQGCPGRRRRPRRRWC